jgi:hypothetical protein
MELCFNVLLGLAIFWSGLFCFAASTGCRFGFNQDDPKQISKIVVRYVGRVLMATGTLFAISKALNNNIWDLPGAIIFLIFAGLGFLFGLFIGVWDIRKNDDFLKAAVKISMYPSIIIILISSFYFPAALIILAFGKHG